MAVLAYNSLPLGFRFRPTDEELVDYYLRLKINGNNNEVQVIREIDVCKWEPWDLPDLSAIATNDPEWFFFCPRDRKYPNGHRLNRATNAGYWKATGKDRKIKSGTSLIGMKKTLVFYTGRAPKGKRTNWVMHEYRPTLDELNGTHLGQNPFVLCRLFKKNDETLEGTNGDDADAGPSSPVARSPHADTESDLVTGQDSPAMVKQDEQSSNDYEVQDQGQEVTDQEETLVQPDWPMLGEPMLEPTFSSLPTQIKAETQSPPMDGAVSNDMNYGHSCVQFPHNTNEDAYITEFLNSILNSTGDIDFEERTDLAYDNTIRNGMLQTSDGKQLENKREDLVWANMNGDRKASTEISSTQEDYQTLITHFNIAESYRSPNSLLGGFDNNTLSSQSALDQSHSINHVAFSDNANTTENGDILATGIRRRLRQPQNPQPWSIQGAQGTARRRLRLQCKLQIGPVSCSRQIPDFSHLGEEQKSELSQQLAEKVLDRGIPSRDAAETSVGVDSAASAIHKPQIFGDSPLVEEQMNSQELSKNTKLASKSGSKLMRKYAVKSYARLFRLFAILAFFVSVIGVSKYMKF